MFDLRMNERRPMLKDILEHAIPMTPQDVVLIFCTAVGMRDGHLMQMTDARKVYHGTFRGLDLSAIQITTAASICAVLDLVREDNSERRPASSARRRSRCRTPRQPLRPVLRGGRENVERIEEPYVPSAV